MGLCYAPPPLSTVNLASFFLQTAARSSYIGETNVVANTIDSSINRTPCRTFDFHPFLETTPKQWPIWPVQDATDGERKN
jgi:hypothetical protein